MRWIICRNDGLSTRHYASLLRVADAISPIKDEHSHDTSFRARVLNWLRAAQLGDVLEFPLGIVVRTSEHATEIGYDQEETG